MIRLRGFSVSSGVACGTAFIHFSTKLNFPRRTISEDHIDHELEKFEEIKQRTKTSFSTLSKNLTGSLKKEADQLLLSHSLIIDDVAVNKDIRKFVSTQYVNIEVAIDEVFEELIGRFRKIKDPYLNQRSWDLIEIRKKLLSNADTAPEGHWSDAVSEASIIVADELTATDILAFDRSKILGVVTETGGAYTHAAILLKSFEIPSIMRVPRAVEKIQSLDMLILNTGENTVTVNPDVLALNDFKRLQESQRKLQIKLSGRLGKKVITRDGHEIFVGANMESVHEAEICLGKGISEVGLFRTEYLFLADRKLISEDEQYAEYKSILQAMKKLPVTIRTIDIGGDKFMEGINLKEENPLLGCRAIRFSLQHQESFREQIRAILRASAFGNARILLPMISSDEELMTSIKIIERCKDELRSEKIPFDEKVLVGMMVEVPSAVLVLPHLVTHVDFVSVGTNDLIQYTLAVDRNNTHVTKLFQPLHPAVLRLIKMSIDACRDAGKPISICGELGGDPFYIPLLIGMGIERLSMNASSILKVKAVINEMNWSDCVRVSQEILVQDSVIKSKQILIDYLYDNLKHLIDDDLIKVY